MKKLLLLFILLSQFAFSQQVNVISTEKLQTTNSEGYFYPRISPDNQFILMTHGNYNGLYKYSLNDKTNLRLSASRTYTVPQLKEMAPFLYSDVSEQTVGNPKLYPSDNNNVDLKYEYFPKSGEVLSLAVFGKFIENPIAKTFINSLKSTRASAV